MPDFIFPANIAHYKDLLATETDARKIAMIRKLLEEEEHKLTEWQAKNPKPKPAE
jgi:CO dehydrogenase/acetyl-CoA synthase beta subunit